MKQLFNMKENNNFLEINRQPVQMIRIGNAKKPYFVSNVELLCPESLVRNFFPERTRDW